MHIAESYVFFERLNKLPCPKKGNKKTEKTVTYFQFLNFKFSYQSFKERSGISWQLFLYR